MVRLESELQWQTLDNFLIDACQEEFHVGHSIVMQHVCNLHGTRLVLTHSDVATSIEMRVRCMFDRNDVPDTLLDNS